MKDPTAADLLRQLTEENAKLRKRCRARADRLHTLAQEWATMGAERDRLAEENERLREDKARLDWLESVAQPSLLAEVGYHNDAGSLREAIDAARKVQGEI